MYTFVFSDVFCDANDELLKEGNIVRYPILAKTLKGVAQEGPDFLYRGRVAEDIASDIRIEGTKQTTVF